MFSCCLKELAHLVLLFLDDGYLGLEAHVFLGDFVEALLELQSFRVESFLILVYLLGKDPAEIVTGEIRLHK
jgi:hypothetical protein